MKRMIHSLITIVAFMATLHSPLMLANANSNDTFNNNNFTKDISDIVNAYYDNHVFSGALIVQKNDQLVFEYAKGFASDNRVNAYELNSVQPIASLTKPMTAALILKLVEQGKIKLSDTLADYFPEFNNDTGKTISLQHVLSHRSGIPNHFVIDGWFNPDFHQQTNDKEFVKIIASLPLRFEPGTDYLYSNPAYFLLGAIIEQATGLPYEQAFKVMLFEPLGMRNTHFVFEQPNNSIQAFQWQADGGYRAQSNSSMRLFGAGAAIQSDVRDIIRFQRAMHNGAFLNQDSLKLMFDADQPFSWKVNVAEMAPDKPITLHSYTGKYDGYSSLAIHFVEDNISMALLSNTGMSYQIKMQLISDIAAVLYQQPVIERRDDAVFKLIAAIVEGNFQTKLKQITSDVDSKGLDESSLNSLAYEMLWSGLANDSLALFAFIENTFTNSNSATDNLAFACRHRLTQQASNRAAVCQ